MAPISWQVTRRSFLLGTAALSATSLLAACSGQAPATTSTEQSQPAAPAAAQPAQAPGQSGVAKPFAGTSLNVMCWSGPYPKWLGDYLPEFQDQTGMQVNYETPGFAVYNQRADLELSTKGSAYDVLNVTFIYSGRWIGAGWFTPFTEYLKDPNKTPPGFDPDDFLPGSLAALKDKAGNIYAFPWIADVYMAGAGRYDLVEQAGLKMPDTFDELTKLLQAIDGKDGVKGFITENHYGWTWIPYLQGFGGNVFRNPPDDLMPTLNTPEAVEAADYFSNMLRNYAPEGALSYNYDQALNIVQQGKVNYISFNHAWITQLGDRSGSKVADTANFSMFPTGPKGRFPGVATHGLGIPVGSKHKDAAWEFIKWAGSKEVFHRMLLEKGYGSQTRRSIINSPEFKKAMTVNGHDTADIYLKTIELGAQGYMTYRTVPVYPQVDQQIDKAIQVIASQQASAKEAMDKAQANSITDLKKAGVNV